MSEVRIETGSGNVARLSCPDCEDGGFEYKGSLSGGLIKVACCGCGLERKVQGPVEVVSSDGARRVIVWDENDVQRRISLEGEAPPDRVRIAFSVERAVKARADYARRLLQHIADGNASLGKLFEFAIEEFIQGHEQEVPEEVRGEAPEPPASDPWEQTYLFDTEAGDDDLPVADDGPLFDGEGDEPEDDDEGEIEMPDGELEPDPEAELV